MVTFSALLPLMQAAAQVRSPPFSDIEGTAAKVCEGLRAELRCNAVWIMRLLVGRTAAMRTMLPFDIQIKLALPALSCRSA